MYKTVQAFAVQPEIQSLLRRWPTLQSDVVKEALAIQAIPAPTFEEQRRTEYVQQRFNEIGLERVHSDDLGNVYGFSPGSDSERPIVMVSAHLDTVFPAATDLAVRIEKEHARIYGPGLGDNSVGVAAMLYLAQELITQKIQHSAGIWWVATVGEEGLGNSSGMRQACAELKDQLGLTIILEGIGISRIYNAGLSVRRLRINVDGPGGHAWLHADRPSAVHHLLQTGADLLNEVVIPADPPAILNIGLIEGGRSINTRAPQASMDIDMRAIESSVLAGIEKSVRFIVSRNADQQTVLDVGIEVIGDRPGAVLADSHPLVESGLAILKHLGFEQPRTEIGSTDANIPLAEGIPTVCVGITTGGNAHSLDEYIDTRALSHGMVQITLLTLIAAEYSHLWQAWNATSEASG